MCSLDWIVDGRKRQERTERWEENGGMEGRKRGLGIPFKGMAPMTFY